MTTDLFDLTTDLVAIPSVSHNEKALADRFERDLRACAWLEVERIGDNVVARTTLGRERRIIMAGHLTPCHRTAMRRPGLKATSCGVSARSI